MKKLSKIKLHNAVELENHEMKMISGGSGANDVCGQGNYNTVCECNDKSAVWCGTYTDGGDSAIIRHCGGSGTCRPARTK